MEISISLGAIKSSLELYFFYLNLFWFNFLKNLKNLINLDYIDT